jgi:hypothetical protein
VDFFLADVLLPPASPVPWPPYLAEVRARAVRRMVFEHEHEYPSHWKAIESSSFSPWVAAMYWFHPSR